MLSVDSVCDVTEASESNYSGVSVDLLGSAVTSVEYETSLAASIAPLSQTFLLHSNPSATKTIYLDFDGHTVPNLSHWTQYNFGLGFTTPAYDDDGNSSFTDTEKELIQNVWARVSENFLPFNVNVTTQDIGVVGTEKNFGK